MFVLTVAEAVSLWLLRLKRLLDDTSACTSNLLGKENYQISLITCVKNNNKRKKFEKFIWQENQIAESGMPEQ